MAVSADLSLLRRWQQRGQRQRDRPGAAGRRRSWIALHRRQLEPARIAVDGTHVYWAGQAEEAIGRVDLELKGDCSEAGLCEKKFLELDGTLDGLATDGDQPLLVGQRRSAAQPRQRPLPLRSGRRGEPLTDLTPDSGDANGAEVQGVLGASEDGSHVYFVANGDLDGRRGKRRRAIATAPPRTPRSSN